MKKLGVIFTNFKKTTKNGKEYYAGKLEESDETLMAFINTSKNGKEYLSLMVFPNNDNKEKTILNDDLPF